jgi:hypothetical protein
VPHCALYVAGRIQRGLERRGRADGQSRLIEEE